MKERKLLDMVHVVGVPEQNTEVIILRLLCEKVSPHDLSFFHGLLYTLICNDSGVASVFSPCKEF